MQDKIKQWLLDRKISERVLNDFLIHEENGVIVIPVKDSFGDLLFNKYRRNPWSEVGPKYWYSKGGHVAIYNPKVLEYPNDELIIINEGEMDTLAVESLGIHSCTSTGGSASFQEDWAILFKDKTNVIICMDNDEAGVKGAIKIQQLIPQAKMLFLPNGYKDITEYLQKHTRLEFLDIPAHSFPIPKDLEFPITKKQIKEKTKEFALASDKVLEISRIIKDGKNINYILQFIEAKYQQYKTLLNKKEIQYETNDKVKNAKNVPIDTLIKFNRRGFAKCLWHTESTGSLYHYKNTNRAFCFGGCGQKDSIDVIQQINNLSFLEAVDYLNNL